jgi:nucleoside-diphosphate-sugar epimerase
MYGSSHCQRYGVFHLNRGTTDKENVPKEVVTIHADIRNGDEAETKLKGHYFDAVVDFIAFEPHHIVQDIQLFRDCTAQLCLSALLQPIKATRKNCQLLKELLCGILIGIIHKRKFCAKNCCRVKEKNQVFPYTIVRPSHTYNQKKVPAIRWLHGFAIEC